MISRYDAMSPSMEVDSKDLQMYPDPLSIDYSKNIILTSPALRYEIDDACEKKLYLLTAAVYLLTYGQYDDIILCWNDVPHVSQLEAGDILYFPEKADLTAFLRGVEI